MIVRGAGPSPKGLHALSVAAAFAAYLIILAGGLPAGGTGGLSLLALVAALGLAARTVPRGDQRPALAPSTRLLALAAALATLTQAIVGALVRQTAASSHSGGALDALLAAVHRPGAGGAAVVVFVSALAVLRAPAAPPWLRALAFAGPVLAAAQILIGAFFPAFRRTHVAVGAALVAATCAVPLLSSARGRSASVAFARARSFLELTKPRITAMVVATFAGGFFLAPGAEGTHTFTWGLLGTALIVAAANALNMVLERDVDGLMERTRRRPLPQRRLSPRAAAVFGAALGVAALPALIATNLLTLGLGVGALAVYVWAYTPLKRRSSAALLVGAVPGAMPPLMGWTAATGRLDAAGGALFAILFVWQVPHFLAIASWRAEEYARAGIQVMPVTAGLPATRICIVLSSAVLAAVSLAPSLLGIAGPAYATVALVAGAAFLGHAILGLRAAMSRAWARSLFVSSLAYLTLLFAALAFDRWIA